MYQIDDRGAMVARRSWCQLYPVVGITRIHVEDRFWRSAATLTRCGPVKEANKATSIARQSISGHVPGRHQRTAPGSDAVASWHTACRTVGETHALRGWRSRSSRLLRLPQIGARIRGHAPVALQCVFFPVRRNLWGRRSCPQASDFTCESKRCMVWIQTVWRFPVKLSSGRRLPGRRGDQPGWRWGLRCANLGPNQRGSEGSRRRAGWQPVNVAHDVSGASLGLLNLATGPGVHPVGSGAGCPGGSGVRRRRAPRYPTRTGLRSTQWRWDRCLCSALENARYAWSLYD